MSPLVLNEALVECVWPLERRHLQPAVKTEITLELFLFD